MKKHKPFANTKLPSFLKGFASAFDLSGQTSLETPDFNNGFQRDAEALRRDWQQIGDDMRKSMDRLAHE